jgi:hypothetical protein
VGPTGNYVSRLFDYPGRLPLTPTAALALIEQTGARYVLEPCGARENLRAGARATRPPPARLRLRLGLFARRIRQRPLSVEPAAQQMRCRA